MRSPVLWARVFFALLLALITYLTLTPDPENAEPGFTAARFIAALLFGDANLGDKVAHFAAYGALGAAACWSRLNILGDRIWAPLFLAAYGAMLEVAQGMGGVRSPEFADGAANALGALTGFFLAGSLAMLIKKVRLR